MHASDFVDLSPRMSCLIIIVVVVLIITAITASIHVHVLPAINQSINQSHTRAQLGVAALLAENAAARDGIDRDFRARIAQLCDQTEV